MQKLTEKEEAIINYFWRESELFVYQLRKKYLDPKSHYNTLSTFVRKLEVKGYLSHKKNREYIFVLCNNYKRGIREIHLKKDCK